MTTHTGSGARHDACLFDLLSYEQPGPYLVSSTQQLSVGQTPVLTAGKTFILGYTNERSGIYRKHPVIIFDDFTTASQYVDFDFKAKSSAMKILSARSGVADPLFMYELLQLIQFHTGDHKRYWISEFSRLTVRVPDLEEQRRIARIIRDINDYIRTLEGLISKKQAVREGMMQELLNGRTRLPGNTRPWIETKAGELGVFKGGSGFPVEHQGAGSGDLPFFKVSDMNSRGNEVFMCSARNYVSEAQRGQLGATRFAENSIVFAKVGAAVFLERKRILAQPSCIDNNMAAMTVDTSKADVRFMHYLLSNFRMASLVATGALPSINGSQLRSIPIRMPEDLHEQRAIVRVLADTDDEIASLERRLSKVRDVKRGMMQELIAGQTRPAPQGASV